jgi:hypothetical protein
VHQLSVLAALLAVGVVAQLTIVDLIFSFVFFLLSVASIIVLLIKDMEPEDPFLVTF